LDSRTIRDSQVTIDDGALLADSRPRNERASVYNPNGLSACEGITFSPEQKRRALKLVSPE
jgi:hypothetical protein